MPSVRCRRAPKVLDVGCDDGQLVRSLGPSLREGLGIDANLVGELTGDRYRLVPGYFPKDVPPDAGDFDVVSMLALFEHIPTEEQPAVVEACYELLVPGGWVVITVPSPAVDPMLDAMVKLRVLDGIEHEQHYGFKPADLPPLFEQGGFSLSRSYRFQLGLNNVFVFDKLLS
jgi:2-polyprenyl-3-methyl-5-hydroxy-6-metoxy-1,4-benzoquinol methylase